MEYDKDAGLIALIDALTSSPHSAVEDLGYLISTSGISSLDEIHARLIDRPEREPHTVEISDAVYVDSKRLLVRSEIEIAHYLSYSEVTVTILASDVNIDLQKAPNNVVTTVTNAKS